MSLERESSFTRTAASILQLADDLWKKNHKINQKGESSKTKVFFSSAET